MMSLRMQTGMWCLVVGILFCCHLSAEQTDKPNVNKPNMVVDLGETSRYIKITAEYSNAVLNAVLPYFSDVSRKLSLPESQTITHEDVKGFHVLPFREMACSLLLKNGSVFDFHFGFVSRYLNPSSPDYVPQVPDVPNQTHKRISQDDAVQLARDAIKRLGISLEDVFAEQIPRVAMRKKYTDTNAVLHYEIQWIDPRINSQPIGEDNSETRKTGLVVSPAVDIQINGENGQFEKIGFMLIQNLKRSSPEIDVTPIPAPLDWPSVNPEYARQLIPMMFKTVDEYARKLSLPIPQTLNSNNVARVEIHDNEGWPHCEIILTNGWRFVYRHTMVNGHYAPDNLFASDNRKIHIKDFEGKWNLTTNQAIAIVRKAMAKLNYPTNNVHMDFLPSVYTTAVDSERIPRLRFEWYYSAQDELQSRLEAEVNADNGNLESLYYDDKAYWNSRPPIDVPISIKN